MIFAVTDGARFQRSKISDIYLTHIEFCLRELVKEWSFMCHLER
jgi:hypothetical protein